jgi:hypothetical protein
MAALGKTLEFLNCLCSNISVSVLQPMVNHGQCTIYYLLFYPTDERGKSHNSKKGKAVNTIRNDQKNGQTMI